MAKRRIFYSFHFNNDVFRVQQVRNIGALEGNEPVSVNQWEEVKKKGDTGIKNWIDENLKNKSCLVVLIGSETANRKWIQYEIKKAWNDGKGVLGVYVHNLNCMKNGKCSKGVNPFEQFLLKNGKRLSTVVKCYDPKPNDAYNDIAKNLEYWIEKAIESRN